MCINKNTETLLIEPTHLYSRRDMVKTYNTQKINLLKQNNKTYVFKSTFDYQNIKDEFKR